MKGEKQNVLLQEGLESHELQIPQLPILMTRKGPFSLTTFYHPELSDSSLKAGGFF